MAPRRSHPKSRNGCITCKKRRVKCDETGPPCTNCKTRHTDCQYAPVPKTTPDHHSRETATNAPLSSDSHAQFASRSSPDGHLVELKLMHHWSTITYETVSSEAAHDAPIWQKVVPDVALSYPFLLHTIFSLTAWHMVCEAPREDSTRQWLALALEYQGHAFSSFSAFLQNEVASEDHDAVLYCSILLFVLALASATSPESPFAKEESLIQHSLEVHELIRGTAALMLRKPECITEHALWKDIPPLLDLPTKDLDPDTGRILSLVNAWNELRAPAPGVAAGDTAEATTYAACRGAWDWLEFLFSTCIDKMFCGYVLSWPTLSGEEYVGAVRGNDPVALIMLVPWGVLMDNLGSDYWYGRGFGRALVEEVALVVEEEGDALGACQEVVAWARGRLRDGGKVEEDAVAGGLAAKEIGDGVAGIALS